MPELVFKCRAIMCDGKKVGAKVYDKKNTYCISDGQVCEYLQFDFLAGPPDSTLRIGISSAEVPTP